MLKRFLIFLVIPAMFLIAGCSGGGDQFAEYQQEEFDVTPIGSSVSKVITFQNNNLSDVAHLVGMNFDAGTNSQGHFRIDKVEIGGTAANPKNKDLTIPAGSILQVYVTYQPLNMDTSIADYDGWETGKPERFVPQKPSDVNKILVGSTKSESSASGEKEAVHRAILALAYDYPKIGIVQVELVGYAVPGPNGETSALGGGGGQTCPSDTGIACYTGGFAIELPDLMTTGPKSLNMPGPVIFKASGSNLSLDMNTFPAVLLVLKGNGPGEPLEGKPISAISIVISGTPDVVATGTFDGTNIQMNGVSFRIRVVLGEIKQEDINPGLQAAVDFNVKDLQMTTKKPYSNGSITLLVDTNLSATPSGNTMFDQFLGNARVVVTLDGNISFQ